MDDPRITGLIVTILGAAAFLVGILVDMSSALGWVVAAVGAVVTLLGAVMIFRASKTTKE